MQDAKEPKSAPSLEEMLNEAEDSLLKTVQTLTHWSERARNILQDRPGVVLASVSVAGFMTGVLLRQGRLRSRKLSRETFAADPLVMFLTGTIAGFTLGPELLRELTKNHEYAEASPFSSIRRRDTESTDTEDVDRFNRR